MGDLRLISQNAEAAGEAFAQEAQKMPSVKKAHDMMVRRNALTMGSLAAEITAENTKPQWGTCPTCEHNYDGACPMGWNVNDLTMCIAPVRYTGPCSSSVYTSDMSVEDKTY